MGRSKHSGPNRMRASERRSEALKKSKAIRDKSRAADYPTKAAKLLGLGGGIPEAIRSRRENQKKRIEDMK